MQALAIFHHRNQQRLAGARRIFQPQNVAAESAIRRRAPVHLFAAGPGGLAFGTLAPRPAGVFLELVNHIQGRRVGGSIQPGADAKTVVRRSSVQQFAQSIFVEIAAAEQGHLGQTAVIQNASHSPGVFGQIAAVDARPLNLNARCSQARRQCNHFMRGGLSVVGVEQQHHVAGLGGGEILEGLLFAIVSLDQGMGHGPEQRNIEAHPGQHGGGAGETGQPSRAGGQQGRLGPVGAAHSEIHQ